MSSFRSSVIFSRLLSLPSARNPSLAIQIVPCQFCHLHWETRRNTTFWLPLQQSLHHLKITAPTFHLPTWKHDWNCSQKIPVSKKNTTQPIFSPPTQPKMCTKNVRHPTRSTWKKNPSAANKKTSTIRLLCRVTILSGVTQALYFHPGSLSSKRRPLKVGRSA